MKKRKPTKRHIVRWADKFELAKTRKDKHLNPHLYREPFFHGDGSPSVRVTITWNKRSVSIRP